jgi:hypothetical protein
MICSSLAAEALPGLSFPALLALAMASRPTFPQVMVIPQLTTRVGHGLHQRQVTALRGLRVRGGNVGAEVSA